jgi:hypothetical protein
MDFTHLPGPEYIFHIHPEYATVRVELCRHVYMEINKKVDRDIVIGKNLLFLFFEKIVADPARFRTRMK